MKKKTKPAGRRTIKTKVISLRMAPDVVDAVEKKAKKMGMSVAEYMRYLIRLGEWSEDIYIKDKNGTMEKVKAV